MKSVKKFLSLVLSLLMVISFVNLPAKAEAVKSSLPYDLKSIVKSTLNNISETDYQRARQQKMESQFGVKISEDEAIPEEANDVDQNDQVRIIVELSAPSTFEMAKSQNVALANAAQFEKKVETTQKAIIEKAKSFGTIRHTYKNLYNGFSATVNFGDIAKIRAISGVKKVTVANLYELDNSNAVKITKADTVWTDPKLGFKGEGTVVAIVDTGIDVEHKDMKLTDTSKVKLTKTEVEQMIAADPLHQGQYFTAKVPFGYNFADMNTIVKDRTSSMHGMHVGGIVGANGYAKGTAPEAQLLAMKVFSNNPAFGSAYNDDIAAAIESSVIHGADVINMSLGSSAGFVDPEDPEQLAIKNATDAGVIVVVSGGNSYYSAAGSTGTSGYYNLDPDSSIVGSPGLFGDTLQVASSENTHISPMAIGYGTMLFPYLTAGANDPVSEFNANEVEYAYCGIGDSVEICAPAAGKIALIQRGSITYVEKIMNAVNAGAIGVIMFNSAAGGDALVNMAYPDGQTNIPAVFIKLSDGIKLRDGLATNNVVTFAGDRVSIPNPEALLMSDFSSWGPTPGLEFKPEVTAPGGNILSTVNDNKYEVMSGTSMAAPHTSGAVALLVQKLRAAGATEKGRSFVELAKNIMISTSEPVLDPDSDNLPYLTRKQGAGLIQIDRAVTTNAYVTDGNGRATVALKEIGLVKTFPIQINNFGTEALTFKAEDKYGVLTTYRYKSNLYPYTEALATGSLAFDKTQVTVNPGASAIINVTLTQTDVNLNNLFEEGFITLTETSGKNPNLVIPYMGFLGQWDGEEGPRMFDAPAWDPSFFYNGSTLIDPAGYYLGFLGEDDYGYPIIDPSVMAFSPNGDEILDNVAPYFNLMRNAGEFEVEVIKQIPTFAASSEVIVRKLAHENNIRKSYNTPAGNASAPKTNSSWSWDGTVFNKDKGIYETAPDGEYYIRLKAKPDMENAEWDTLDLPIKLDTKAPVVEASGNKINATDYEITLGKVEDGSGVKTYLSYIETIDSEEPIVNPVVFKDGKATIKLPDSFEAIGLIAIDYAGNESFVPLAMPAENNGIDIMGPEGYYSANNDITIKYQFATLIEHLIDHVEIIVNGKAPIENGKNLSYTFTDLPDGKYTIVVRPCAADHTAIAEDYVEYVVDTTNPVITLPNGEDTVVDITKGEEGYVLVYNVADLAPITDVQVDGKSVGVSKTGMYKYFVELGEVDKTVTIKAIDYLKHETILAITFNVDLEKPIITLSRPSETMDVVRGKAMVVEGTAIYKPGTPVTGLTVNGAAVTMGTGGSFSKEVTVDTYGVHPISVQASVTTPGGLVSSEVTRDIMFSPFNFTEDRFFIKGREQKIEYSITTDSAFAKLEIGVNGHMSEQPLTNTEYVATGMKDGINIVEFKLYDKDGVFLCADYVLVNVDNGFPSAYEILDHFGNDMSEGQIYNEDTIHATVTPDEEIQYLEINGVEFVQNDNGEYVGDIVLPQQGINSVSVVVVDMIGNKNEYQLKAWLDSFAPEVVMEQPTSDLVVTNEDVYTVKLGISDNCFGYKLYVNGNQVLIDEDGMGYGTEVTEFTYNHEVQVGTSYIEIVAVDMAGNKFEKLVKVVKGGAAVSATSLSYDYKTPAAVELAYVKNTDELANVYLKNGDKYETLAKDTDYTVTDTKVALTEAFISGAGLGAKELTFEFKSGIKYVVVFNITDTRANNLALAKIQVGGVDLVDFDANVFEYVYELSAFGTTLPQVTGLVPEGSTAVVEYVQAAKVGDTATIKVKAENGTERVYSIKFIIPLVIEKLSTETSYVKGSQAVIKFKATNVTNMNKDVTLIVGVYDSSNKLVSIMTGGYLVKIGESVVMSATLTTPNQTGYKIKCFVWDSMDGMKALSEVVELPIN